MAEASGQRDVASTDLAVASTDLVAPQDEADQAELERLLANAPAPGDERQRGPTPEAERRRQHRIAMARQQAAEKAKADRARALRRERTSRRNRAQPLRTDAVETTDAIRKAVEEAVRRQARFIRDEQLSPSEKRAAAAALPGTSVAWALLTSEHFRDAVDRHDPESVASLYTVRASAGRAAVARLAERCQNVPFEFERSSSRFLYVAATLSGWVAFADAPAPEARFRLGEVERSIVALLLFAEGRCVECGTVQRAKHRGTTYLCDSHTTRKLPPEAEEIRRKAQRQVESALEALGRVVTADDHRRHVDAYAAASRRYSAGRLERLLPGRATR